MRTSTSGCKHNQAQPSTIKHNQAQSSTIKCNQTIKYNQVLPSGCKHNQVHRARLRPMQGLRSHSQLVQVLVATLNPLLDTYFTKPGIPSTMPLCRGLTILETSDWKSMPWILFHSAMEGWVEKTIKVWSPPIPFFQLYFYFSFSLFDSAPFPRLQPLASMVATDSISMSPLL